MKHLIKFTLMALLGSIIMVSCQKDKGPKPQPQKKGEEQITLKQMANPDNPYDKQGKLHNQFLDFAAKTIDFKSTKALNADQLINLTKKFYASKKMDFGADQNEGYMALFDAYSELNYGIYPGPLDPFGGWLCKYFPWLCGYRPDPFPFLLLQQTNGGTATERTLKFIDAVKKMEQKALADKDLDDRLKSVLLCRSSVARFSAGYWHNVIEIEKDKSPYYEPIQAMESDCVTCDILGGDAAGAAVGVLVAGVGAGPGAAIGSLAVATEKFFRWLW